MMCELCNEAEAATRSTNQDWSGYHLCESCAKECDERPPIYADQHYENRPD